jgi:hypothetical protein
VPNAKSEFIVCVSQVDYSPMYHYRYDPFFLNEQVPVTNSNSLGMTLKNLRHPELCHLDLSDSFRAFILEFTRQYCMGNLRMALPGNVVTHNLDLEVRISKYDIVTVSHTTQCSSEFLGPHHCQPLKFQLIAFNGRHGRRTDRRAI